MEETRYKNIWTAVQKGWYIINTDFLSFPKPQEGERQDKFTRIDGKSGRVPGPMLTPHYRMTSYLGGGMEVSF